MICILCPICTWNVRRYLDKPRIYLLQPSVEAVSGKDAHIKCKIKSKLRISTVRWQRHDSNTDLEDVLKYFVKKDDATLTIYEVNKTDSGTYNCVVTNFIGSSKSNPIILTVVEKPRILFKQPSGIAFNGQTENVQIECKIESMKDILDVRWHKDGINLENGSKYCFKMEHDATLTIREVNLTDAGTYTCFVRNCIGCSKSNPFTLTVKDLNDAEEIRHYIRVIIIGKEGVGKSSLMKRLLWKSPSEILSIPSTDGIDISIAECEIDVEDGKWMPYNEATDDLVQRFERAFAKQHTETESKNNDPSEILSDLDHPGKTNMALSHPNEPNQQLDEQPFHNNEANYRFEETHKITNPESKTEKEQTNASLSKIIPEEQKKNTKYSSNELSVVDAKNEESSTIINSSSDINEKEIDDAATALINSVKAKHATTNTSSKRTASCWLWDFAGQKDFYATHQAFLSSCAVFLLVADITDDISIEHNRSEDFQHAGGVILVAYQGAGVPLFVSSRRSFAWAGFFHSEPITTYQFLTHNHFCSNIHLLPHFVSMALTKLNE